MRKLTSFVVALAVPVFVVSMAAPGLAEEQPVLNIHGFGGWAAGYTSNKDFLFPDAPLPIATHDLQVDNSYFTLNLLARPIDKVTILAQPTWQSSLRGREARLDLAYVEVAVAKDLLVRAGKVKNPLGLYTEIYKVGTLRPFYLLPVSYYRLAPESYSGVGVSRRQRLGSWELELDAFGGQMDIGASDSDLIVGFDQTTMQYQFASIPVTSQGRKVFGGGVLVRPSLKGLQFGASAYSMKLYASALGEPYTLASETRQKAYAGCLEYLSEKVSLRSELLLLRGIEKSNAWYVEAAYYLTSHWQVAGTYDALKVTDPPAPTPEAASLKKHGSFGAGLNYWFSPKLVWKLDYYRVKDNRAARPDNAINAAVAGNLKKDTDVLVGGVHFSF